MLNLVVSLSPCCGSGMIYSGSGSSFEFSEFRIRIQPILLRHHCNFFKYFKFNHKEEFTNYLTFSMSKYSPTILYTQSKIHRPKIKYLFIYSFIFCWIRIRNNNSGSRQKFRIHADPDPQHCNVSSVTVKHLYFAVL